MDSLKDGHFTFSRDTVEQDFTLLTAALDASITGIIITDNRLTDNPIIYCNSAFEKMTGYDRKEIIGHNCRLLQREDRTQKERQQLREGIDQGKPVMVEIRNYTKTGTLFWNELYVSPIKDASGKVTHFIGIQHDVTRRKQAEAELENERQLMEQRIEERTQSLKLGQEYVESIVQTVRESLIVLDNNYKVLSVNDHFLRTFKVNKEETENKLLFDLGNGQWNIPRLKELLEKVLPTNNPVVDFQVEHDFPYIGHKVMLLNAHRIEYSGEYKDRILIAIEDITDRSEIEKRKDDFLTVASHELKTPLTTIKGYVQMMNRFMPEETDEKFKDILAKTAQFIDRLSNLITELLDVSRIQTGKMAIHREMFDFDQMIAETVEGIQAASKSHQIIIKGEPIGSYNGDESHLIQVVNNLVSNAVKYSPESKIVEVHKAFVSDYIKLSVIDNGMGISAEDQQKIFERFYRAGDIQTKFPGMGVGLYICDQIIKQHGGTLWVESEKGKGSNFSFTLPTKEAPGKK
ncbi:PAS domain-containing protein [Mucilaginibacter sp. RS28]|uniref:histidine kinase n=1 Tax=Mucilaginibacter straminoryzae TaxID=2932774 RepID=A0A9X2BAX6_9SPHI|nr:PAS domain-containing sensor histidine kinase [Mucilaginibacter straminoryzae]MCJ8209252.1 PAS domain-containing protein [Mucilaginibacter straminoryzae]